MAEIMQHLTAIADEVGPRPATSDAESRTASYIESVFVARGLEPETQEFDSPRTYTWAYTVYHFLTMVSAACAGAWLLHGGLAWAAFGLSALVAFVMWNDLDTRWGLTRLMPKGPSQNVIARHIPKARRGEKLRKVVIVAHYDTARASLAFAPGVVGQFPVTFALLKAATFLTPVLILVIATPWADKVDLYLWYATLVVAGYLLIPTFINIQRELLMPFVDGANDNASGVAAMLGVLHNLVAEPEAGRFATSQFAPVRRSPEAAEAADVVPEGALLSYSPAGSRDPSTQLPDDFEWAESGHEAAREPQRGQGLLEFETIEFEAVGERRSSRGEEMPGGPDVSAEPLAGPSAPEQKKRGLLGRGRGKKAREESGDVKGWLGVGDEFDARKAGKEIGSWDNFGDEDDDAAGGLGWKGGWAGDDPIEDDDFASNEAARIRRRVTETIDRDFAEKEVWFVATGAEEVGTVGMQAFLKEFGEELRDALIINIDNVGAGQLSWVTAEGMARRYRANQRIIGLAKRVSREQEILVKPRVYKGLSTDATPALARGFKAMTLMAFDGAGVPVNWHWKSDVTENIEVEVIERTIELVTHMIREA